MAASKCVVVLAPNGRRQNVKVTPNMTILQVLEEVCRKQGFKPEEYDIKHHNNILDTTSIIRFSGLPNNAQLEMAAAQKIREETTVVVGLQLETGDRLMGDFLPTDSLWGVIKKLCPDEADPNSNPVIIYMRSEVSGVKALEETTLRSLGLIGGRAMLRFVHRTPEELHHQANVSRPLSERHVAKFEQQNGPESDESPEYPPNIKSSVLGPGYSSGAGTPHSSGHGLFQSPAVTSLHILPSSTAENGNQTQNTSRGSTFPSCSIQTVLADQKEGMDIGSHDRFCVESNDLSMETSAGSSEATVASVPELKEPNEEIILLGERNAIAFSLEMVQAVPCEDLPDDFFELTQEDARALLRDLKRRRTELEEAPLVTSAWRSQEESERMLSQLNHYRQAVIRIQFPDRTVLQGTFLPLETISVVMDFVRSHLENPGIDFHLYTTPPKSILIPGMRIVDAGCVPSAMIHFGTKNHITSGGKTYLREAILTQFTSPSAATLAACQSRGIKPGAHAFSSSTLAHHSHSGSISHVEGKSSTVSPEDEQAVNIDYGRSTSYQLSQRQERASSSKVPKWFKPIK